MIEYIRLGCYGLAVVLSASGVVFMFLAGRDSKRTHKALEDLRKTIYQPK